MNPDNPPQSPIVASLDVSPVINENSTPLIAVENESSNSSGTNVPGATYQFFFRTAERNTSLREISKETELECTPEQRSPVSIGLYPREISWRCPGNVDTCLEYEIVIGISFKDFPVDSIEEVNFQVGEEVELFVGNPHFLEKMVDNTGCLLKWKLRMKVRGTKLGSEKTLFSFRPRPTHAPQKSANLELHFMELYDTRGLFNFNNDPLFRVPDWSPDLRRIEGANGTKAYGLSESGDYLVTLTEQDDLELWSLKSDLTSSNPNTSRRVALATSRRSRIYEVYKHHIDELRLSVSYDGSRILVSGKMLPWRLYDYSQNNTTNINQDLVPATLSLCLGTSKYRNMVYHRGSGPAMMDPGNEVCLIEDRHGVRISDIVINGRKSTAMDIRVIRRATNLESIQSRHFACQNNDKTISVWNIDSGRVVCTIKPAQHPAGVLSLSADATYLVICGQRSATSYDVSTGLPYHTEQIRGQGRLRSIRGDNTVMVSEKGLEITIPELQTLDRYSLSKFTQLRHISKSGDSLNALLFDCPTINEQRFYEKPLKSLKPLKPVACHVDCLARLEPIDSGINSYVDFESGLNFSLSVVEVAESGRELSIQIQDHSQLEKNRVVLVATLDNRLSKATFVPKERSLVLLGDNFICVFGMPSSLEDNPVLRIVNCLNEDTVSAHPDSPKTDPPNTNTPEATLPNKQCPHGRFYYNTSHHGYRFLDSLKVSAFEWPPDSISKDHILVYLKRHINDKFLTNNAEALFTSKTIQLSIILRSTFRNFEMTVDSHRESVMEYICKRSKDHMVLPSEVITGSECEWIPPSRDDFNPMKYFLDNTNSHDETHKDSSKNICEDNREDNMANFKICLDYCLLKTVSTRNTAYLGPITAVLPILLDATRPHIELAKSTLRAMAFILAISPTFIMDHRAVIHPSRPHRRIWKSSARRSFTYEEPILQLETLGQKDQDNAARGNIFTFEVFAATFDILWTDHGAPARPGPNSKPAGVSPSVFYWIKMFPFMAYFKTNPWRTSNVRFHDFPRDFLDNPAIAALITYKWATLGFTPWLFRFMFQCIYYFLILCAVFVQVYVPDHRSLVALYWIIAIMSVTFLLLELSQMHHWKRYRESLLYNLVDVVTFSFPLAACINQFVLGPSENQNVDQNPRGPNSWLFSFSIIFNALHLLFELRVNKSVCKFVTIFVQIFGRIRIFFVIFLGGILSFTVALMHLLRGCVQEPCSSLDPNTANNVTNFPGNFYQAFSATFFFMGGKFDPVSSEFTQNYGAFHTMMLVYFMFTVIIMLNVLIALVNMGFDDSDTTWQQVWLLNQLGYIESAENMSYEIPGLRENFDIFPKEIYYSLSTASINEYKKRWAEDEELYGFPNRMETPEGSKDISDPIAQNPPHSKDEQEASIGGTEDDKNAQLLAQLAKDLLAQIMKTLNQADVEIKKELGEMSKRINDGLSRRENEQNAGQADARQDQGTPNGISAESEVSGVVSRNTRSN